MFQYNRDCTPTPCEPGVTRRVMTYTKDVMLCEITFETGARGNEHSHPPYAGDVYRRGKIRIHDRRRDKERGKGRQRPDAAERCAQCSLPGGGETCRCLYADARGVCLSFCFGLRRAAEGLLFCGAPLPSVQRDVQYSRENGQKARREESFS